MSKTVESGATEVVALRMGATVMIRGSGSMSVTTEGAHPRVLKALAGWRMFGPFMGGRTATMTGPIEYAVQRGLSDDWQADSDASQQRPGFIRQALTSDGLVFDQSDGTQWMPVMLDTNRIEADPLTAYQLAKES